LKTNWIARTALAGMAAVAMAVGGVGRANAMEITRAAVDSGWYDQTGSHVPENLNYLCGFNNGIEFRNFFVFDLSGIDLRIVSAELQIQNPTFGYFSADPTETYTLFDVSTPVSTLSAGGEGLTSIFADLGSGVSYGSQVVSHADDDRIVTISLNAAGIAALNEANGQFAFGGAITTLSREGFMDEYVFGETGFVTDTRQLVIEASSSVPEGSSTWGLLLLGLTATLGFTPLLHRSA
jgi:large repetitive protein